MHRVASLLSSTLWVALFPLFVAATGALAQDRSVPPVALFTEHDDGRIVRLPVGAELTVRLPEQAGTAYQWMLKDNNNVRRIGEPRVDDVAPRGIVGGPQLRTFRLQIVAGGRTPLKFRLRPVDGRDDRAVRRFDLTVDADTMRYIPTDYGSDDRRLITVNESDANRIVSTELGRPIEIHLSADPSSGDRWEVLSSRNIAFERPIGVEYKPGIFGFGAGPETIVRLHTTVNRSDGFLELVYTPRGQRPSWSSNGKRLSYQFSNRR